MPSSPLPWDPQFLRRSTLFAPLEPAATDLHNLADWPDRDFFNGMLASMTVTSGSGKPLRPVAPQSSAESSHPGYDAHCFLTGELETRERNWHDLFNALVWLTFPQSKAALNARHYHAQQTSRGQNKRGADRDALTLFDESGVIVVSTEASLLTLLQTFSWKELFWHRRDDTLAAMRVFIFGHGLYEQALQPFIGLTGKAILLPVEESFIDRPLNQQLAMLDKEIAGLIHAGQLKHPRELSPLPILGVPGWIVDNENEDFYDNTNYFRPGRKTRDPIE
ncbi:MAG: DUF3025 domain-containing protein [Pseudomonadota bacterium]